MQPAIPIKPVRPLRPIKPVKTKKEGIEIKPHHKIIIGSFSTIVIIFMIVNGALMYALFVKQKMDYNELSSAIKETQNNINTLSENLIETRKTLEQTIESLDVKIGNIGEEFNLLKASAGEDFSGIINEAIKSVVTIKTDVGQGTGFIVHEDGYIVTNAHVLVGGREVRAITYDQKELKAEFIGYNNDLDLALLKIPGKYKPLELADSNKVQIGEKVIAIGNPLGLQFSVSQGIVSGIHRPGLNEINAYIQTDAALNPGNSGGPLINKEGKVIGINNFKIGGGENLGFALESNYIKRYVNRIAKTTLNQTLI